MSDRTIDYKSGFLCWKELKTSVNKYIDSCISDAELSRFNSICQTLEVVVLYSSPIVLALFNQFQDIGLTLLDNDKN